MSPKHFALAAATAATLGLTSTAVTADDDRDGAYVSASVGASTLSHNINRNTGSMTNPSISTSVDNTDISLRAGLGYKSYLSDKTYLGVEGYFAWQNGETTTVNGMLESTLDLKYSYGADVRLGHQVSDTTSLYALAGITAIKFDNNTGYTFAPPMQFLTETETGLTYGVGAEVKLSNKVSLIGEYRLTKDVRFTPNPDVVGGFVNDNQINLDTLRIGLNFGF